MKKRILFTVVTVLTFSLLITACRNPFHRDDPVKNTAVTLNAITADGSSTKTTTALTLAFSQEINGLAASDIALSGVSGVNKGTLSGSGPVYTLPINGFISGGVLSISVTKSGYDISGLPKTVNIYIEDTSQTPTTFTVTYYPNGGTPAPQSPVTRSLDDSIEQPAAMTRDGFTFNNWYTDPDFSNVAYFPFVANYDIALYAKWNSNSGVTTYTVTYHADGGTPTPPSSVTMALNETIQAPSSMTKTGYTFDKWYTDSSFTTAASFPITVTGNISLYAKWIINQYTVTYYPDGGTPTPQNTTKKHGETITVPSTMTKTGHTFDKWYTNSSFTTAASFPITVTGNISLYAKWNLKNLALPLTDENDVVDYLASQSGGTSASNPIALPVSITGLDIDTLGNLFAAIGTSGKYVNLDLSECTMTEIEFNYADVATRTGMSRIVEIILPDTAISIEGSSAYSSSLSSLFSISGAGIKTIGKRVFAICTKLTTVDFPCVTSIDDSAFAGCTSLASVTLSTGLTSIGNYAFLGCTSLTAITLPANLSYNALGVFEGCTSLVFTVTGTGSLHTIDGGKGLVRDTTLLSYPSANGNVDLSASGLTIIFTTAFNRCTGLSSITLPASLTSIGSYAFNGCTGLSSITLPASLTSIGSSAFSRCTGLSSVTLPSSVSYLNLGTAFEGCTSLIFTVTGSGALSTIEGGKMLVRDTTLLSYPSASGNVDLSVNGFTVIGDSAFALSNLTSITLPASLTSIGANAFYGCTNLAMVICEAITPPTLGSQVFLNTHASLQQIKVPAGSVAAYKAAPGWSEWADRIVAQ